MNQFKKGDRVVRENAGWSTPQLIGWLTDDLRRGAGRSGLGDADLFVHNVRMRAISMLIDNIESFAGKAP
jgi:hypothetical protein